MDEDFADELREELPTGVPSVAETAILLQTAKPKGRNYLIYRLLYFGGLRRGEVVELLVGDFVAEHRILFVRDAKFHKDRYVLLDRVTAELLMGWIGKAPPQQKLFELNDPQAITNSFRKCAEACGIYQEYQGRGLRISAHSMRHAFATHRYELGMDIWAVGALLGHTLLHTTVIYLKTASLQWESAYDVCGPFSDALRTPLRLEPEPLYRTADEDGHEVYPEDLEIAREFRFQAEAAGRDSLPAAPSSLEIQRILEDARADSSLYRLVRLLYGSGIWLEEAMALEGSDLLVESRRLKLGSRMALIDRETMSLLASMGEGPLFPISRAEAQERICNLPSALSVSARLAAISRPFSVDSLRHSFAIHASSRNIDRISLMKQLGHEFISTTNVYFRCGIHRFLAEYDASTPPFLLATL